MADRQTFNGSSTDVPWVNTSSEPEGFGDQYARHIQTLYDAASFPLTAIGGTADDLTATLDPVLSGALQDGMKFSLTTAAPNTGPMTLAINGGSAIDLVDSSGAALIADQVDTGSRILIEYIGGDFRIMGGAGQIAVAQPYYLAITASTTWNRPAGYADDQMIVVQLWGGGGGGATASAGAGGGGAGYREIRVRYADMPSSVAVTIGAGGAAGLAGGTTSFGSLAFAYGGGGAVSNTSGGGGGALGSGSGVNGGRLGGGTGVTTNAKGGDGTGFGGGAGGGAGSAGDGGDAVFGGGGGGGRPGVSPLAAGGRSVLGGDGGAADSAGVAPGGGGGRNSSGARGEIRIWISG
jgi:hypothetical protein